MNQSEIHEKVEIVLRQTNYSREEAEQKLKLYNYDYTKVILDFIKSGSNQSQEKSEERKVKSVNQEIYRNIRHYLDNGVVDKARQRGYYQEVDNYSNNVELELKDKEDNNENTIIDL